MYLNPRQQARIVYSTTCMWSIVYTSTRTISRVHGTAAADMAFIYIPRHVARIAQFIPPFIHVLSNSLLSSVVFLYFFQASLLFVFHLCCFSFLCLTISSLIFMKMVLWSISFISFPLYFVSQVQQFPQQHF